MRLVAASWVAAVVVVVCAIQGVDASIGTLTAVPPTGAPPTARFYHVLALHPEAVDTDADGHPDAPGVVVFGGMDANSRLLGDMWVFSMTTCTWAEQPVLGAARPAARMSAAHGVFGRRLVVAGGDTDLGLSDAVWAYDFLSREWQEVDATGTPPPARFRAASTQVSVTEPNLVARLPRATHPSPGPGRPVVMAFGGTTFTGLDNGLFAYVLDADAWVTLVPPGGAGSPSARAAACMLGLPTGVVVTMGLTEDAAGDARLHHYDFSTLSWSTAPVGPHDPSPVYLAACSQLGPDVGVVAGGWNASRAADVDDVHVVVAAGPHPQWQRHEFGNHTHAMARDSAALLWVGGVADRTCLADHSPAPSLLLFGGFRTTLDAPAVNDMYVMDAAVGAVAWGVHMVADHADWPTPRWGHSAAVISGVMYVFGGAGAADGRQSAVQHVGLGGETVHDDLWKAFLTSGPDVDDGADGTVVWELVPAASVSPHARYRHTASRFGALMVVFGGFDGHFALNDMWVYSTTTNTWRVEEYRSPAPSAVYGHCAAFVLGRLHVYGGTTGTAVQDQLLVYSLVDSVWETLTPSTPSSPRPPPLVSCGAARLSATSIVMGFGDTSGDLPVGELWQLDASDTTTAAWSQLTPDVGFPRARAAFALAGDVLFVHGGEQFTVYLQSDLRAVSVVGGVVRTMVVANASSGLAALGPVTDHAAVYWGRSLYVFGGRLSLGGSPVGIMGRSQLFRWSTTTPAPLAPLAVPSGRMPCAPGAVLVAPASSAPGGVPVCEACPPGTYSDAADSVLCKPCQPGFYQPAYGADSVLHCTPCSAGFFNPSAGAPICIPCPPGAHCPVASSVVEPEAPHVAVNSSQPEALSTHAGFVTRATVITALVWAGLFVAAVVALLFFKDLARRWLPEIDLLKLNHLQQADGVWLIKSNVLGGLLTILLVCVVCVLVVVSFVGFAANNRAQFQALIPDLLVEHPIVADMSAKVRLLQYTGRCVADRSSTRGACAPGVSVAVDVSAPLTQGRADDVCEVVQVSGVDACEATLSCYGCAFGHTHTVVVTFRFAEVVAAGSGASGVSMFVEASSSIPRQNSTVSSVLLPPNGFVLRGPDASVFEVLATPSTTSRSGYREDLTGFHVDFGLQRLGSITPAELYQYEAGLSVDMQLQLGSWILHTRRVLRQDLVTLVATLLAGIVGVMSTFMVILPAVEWLLLALRCTRLQRALSYHVGSDTATPLTAMVKERGAGKRALDVFASPGYFSGQRIRSAPPANPLLSATMALYSPNRGAWKARTPSPSPSPRRSPTGRPGNASPILTRQEIAAMGPGKPVPRNQVAAVLEKRRRARLQARLRAGAMSAVALNRARARQAARGGGSSARQGQPHV